MLVTGITVVWKGSPSKHPSVPRYYKDIMMRNIRQRAHQDEVDRLADLNHGLEAIVKGVGKIPFRDRLIGYALLETEAESLVGVNHEEFYLNPERLPDSQEASAHLMNLVAKLLERVKEQRQRVRKQIATGD